MVDDTNKKCHQKKSSKISARGNKRNLLFQFISLEERELEKV
jgi:hypothetical protein